MPIKFFFQKVNGFKEGQQLSGRLSLAELLSLQLLPFRGLSQHLILKNRICVHKKKKTSRSTKQSLPDDPSRKSPPINQFPDMSGNRFRTPQMKENLSALEEEFLYPAKN